eukprot:m.92032 g.92032  ORF g.92032 m.92032 type:complete len:304 (-) comp12004_c0_seq2:210-1121(-)
MSSAILSKAISSGYLKGMSCWTAQTNGVFTNCSPCCITVVSFNPEAWLVFGTRVTSWIPGSRCSRRMYSSYSSTVTLPHFFFGGRYMSSTMILIASFGSDASVFSMKQVEGTVGTTFAVTKNVNRGPPVSTGSRRSPMGALASFTARSPPQSSLDRPASTAAAAVGLRSSGTPASATPLRRLRPEGRGPIRVTAPCDLTGTPLWTKGTPTARTHATVITNCRALDTWLRDGPLLGTGLPSLPLGDALLRPPSPDTTDTLRLPPSAPAIVWQAFVGDQSTVMSATEPSWWRSRRMRRVGNSGGR